VLKLLPQRRTQSEKQLFTLAQLTHLSMLPTSLQAKMAPLLLFSNSSTALMSLQLQPSVFLAQAL
jgi:hypothetical protein